MSLKIGPDVKRFQERYKQEVRKNIHKQISNDELIGKQGDKIIKIPIKRINIPRFKYDLRDSGGIGQGDGNEGDPLEGNPNGQSGQGKEVGDNEGELVMEVDLSINELTDILIEVLGLPHLEPKGNKNIDTQKRVYNKIGKTGTNIHLRRTLKETLSRESSIGNYNPNNPILVPIKNDLRYKISKPEPRKHSNAVLIYMLDVSGSMETEQRRHCKIINYWLENIIERKHPNVESRYIVHTTVGKEVKKDSFYEASGTGGTHISSALELCTKIIKEEYKSDEWNIYPFYYSDGDNWSSDNKIALNILEELLPLSNMFCYGQCEKCETNKSQNFLNVMKGTFNSKSKDYHKIRATTILTEDDLMSTLELFLNKDNIPFYEVK